MAALRLPRIGRVFELGHVLDSSSPGATSHPIWPHVIWHQVLLAHGALEHAARFDPMIAPSGSATHRRPSYFEEHVTLTHHLGTHVDALGHVGVGDYFYNHCHYADIYSPGGLRRLGIEHVRPWLVRGLLLDVAAIEGVEMLPEGFVVRPTHLAEAIRRAGTEVRAGDAVIVHTGWSRLWHEDPQRYVQGEPGLGLDAARWLSDRRVSLVAADNIACEVFPSEREADPAPVHQHLLAEAGVNILENVFTADLVAAHATEFLFVLSPAKTRGSTGALAAPLAVI